MKPKTKSLKKLRIVKTTIQNLNRPDLQHVRGGMDYMVVGADEKSVKPGYPCVCVNDSKQYISEPGYGSTCPPKPDETDTCKDCCIKTCHCVG